jgi:hypothetical protein
MLISGMEAATTPLQPTRRSRAWLRVKLSEFDETSALQKLGDLAAGAARTRFATQHLDQVRAWQAELRVLASATLELRAIEGMSSRWSWLLEYEIPRREKRIDAVLLADDIIVVVEFKVGALRFHRADIWQTEDYALDLRDFHEASHGRSIAAVLVATEASSETRRVDNRGSIPVRLTNAARLAHELAEVISALHQPTAPQIDVEGWDASPYRPTPTIVEATQHLFAGNTVRDMSHAYADNLSITVDAIAAEVERARSGHVRTVCFVTGVPGAGKTLAGLASVHDPSVSGGTKGEAAFMSGNGPLVHVLREVLVRDAAARAISKAAAQKQAELMVQNIHKFIEEHGIKNPHEQPHEHVVVFDEAQRAWHAKKMRSWHQTVERSEPDLVLDVMSRAGGWSVLIALVGGGQEIHDGEAGLEEWGRALRASSTPWRVVVSPEALDGGTSVADHKLFDGAPPHHVSVVANPAMHLSVSVRSPRAQQMAQWVNAVLRLDGTEARQALQALEGFRLGITRDLDAARSWLRDASRGEAQHRCGLLSSSGNLRARAYGLELTPQFLNACPVERWFLDGPEDVRSSYALEVAMSEFKVQGLELDYVGLCWGDDLTVSTDAAAWDMRRFRGSKWLRVVGEIQQGYLLNKYRVLLTRAREGMLIWVPPGDREDPTRDPARLDRTAAFLEACGVERI